jgi:hypothetical protein
MRQTLPVCAAFLQLYQLTRALDFLVNVFPWLEYVPSWFPGAGWKRKAMAWNKVGEDLINVPFEWTKQQMVFLDHIINFVGPTDECIKVNGTAQPSALSSILTKVTNIQSEGDRAEEEDRIKWAIGSFYGGIVHLIKILRAHA